MSATQSDDGGSDKDPRWRLWAEVMALATACVTLVTAVIGIR